MNKTYTRNENDLKIASSGVIMLSGVTLFGAFIGFVGLMVSFICQETMLAYIFLAMAIGMMVIGFACDNIFEYKQNYQIETTKNGLICRYELNKSLLPTNKNNVVVICDDITSIKATKKRITLKGNFTKKIPMKGKTLISHYEIDLKNFPEEDCMEILEHCKQISNDIVNK